MGKMRNVKKITFVRKPGRNRPRGRSRARWRDNMKLDLREIDWEDVDWMHLAEVRDQWRKIC
jgi:hypothetical protein